MEGRAFRNSPVGCFSEGASLPRWLLPDAASGQSRYFQSCHVLDPDRAESEVTGARRVWRTFCRPGTNFIEHYACRGTSLIGAANLSPVTNLVAGTGAVSRYKLSRSQKSVKVQDFNCGQMRVSGCNNHYKFVLRCRSKAKTVTNNLPILSVLAAGVSFLKIINHFFYTVFWCSRSQSKSILKLAAIKYIVHFILINHLWKFSHYWNKYPKRMY